MPRRIQLSRRKGWRKPANTVVVSRPSRWGNPFAIREGQTADMVVTDYREWLKFSTSGQFVCMAAKKVLRGKDLACWCRPGTPCHADVLLEIANAPEAAP